MSFSKKQGVIESTLHEAELASKEEVVKQVMMFQTPRTIMNMFSDSGEGGM